MTKVNYLRDGRAPIPKSEHISKVMSSNKGKNTKPEIIMRNALRKKGLTGYRIHSKKIPGKPDIAFVNKKIAIFVHGCFWHRCPHCNLPIPKSNTEFWKEKFDSNIQRDNEKIKKLKNEGWNVIVIWECNIKKDVKMCVKNIQKEIGLKT